MASPISRLINQLGAPPAEASTNALSADVARLGEERDQLSPVRARHMGAVGGTEQRLRSRLGRQASMRAAQTDRATPTSFRGALDMATRRTRARQGIVNRGDAAIRNQALRDRIAVARGTARRRGSLQNALQQAANIREGVNVGISDANQLERESRAGMFGAIGGGLTSFIQNNPDMLRNMFSRGFAGMGQGVTEASLNAGTAIADTAPIIGTPA